ncbi:trypsin-like peptidase domain-containing protein [Bradyrhizobium liaoningense]|uniref:trypsin-like peptidase domain-containing protein n=1 Tax=Bradyrhizobium liaoningense TaxID=43992 RepID=UPI001BA6528C|nr:trypsin-like peptidase domain-containing protein [Bradyrhizobium liaoningense]MBR0820270.1 trypsin-like peptidase domain-containing protein [Bradyrhizobium liaoningense]
MNGFTGYLSDAEILAISDAIIAVGLGGLSNQEAMLSGVLPAYATLLPSPSLPKARMLAQLSLLNKVHNLRNGDVPLAQYLAFAANLASATQAAEIIENALEKVNRVRTGSPASTTPAPQINAQITPEAYARGADGTLDVKFLRAGAEAAASVVKLLVHRHMDGMPQFEDGDKPRLVSGTGWIIASGLVVTNHHVINARSDFGVAREADASDQDFKLQSENTHILYDYLDKNDRHEMYKTLAGALICADKGLDFAIFRVPETAPNRPPLRFRTHAIRKTPDQPLGTGVNVLQHPNGDPMRIGFRDNFVVVGDDTILSYLTDTASGSSGSPVCDDSWSVAALHRGSRPVSNQNIQIRGIQVRRENYGTPIPTLMEKLRVDFAAAHAQILAGRS